MNSPQKPDWDSFETYKGPEEEESGWSGKFFHWLMIFLLLVIVFAVCGGLAYIVAFSRYTARLVANESSLSAGIRFCVGGALGVGWVIRALYGKKRAPFV